MTANETAAQAAPAAPAGTPEARIAELEAQVKEKEQKYLYLYADFENFKKRVVKERSDLMKYGWENLARELLLVVDNLERALSHAAPSTDKNLLDGLKMVMGQFHATLERQGIRAIATQQTAFDPNLHEAVAQESSPSPDGTIVKEELKGYTLHGRLLRPARVVVSGTPQPAAGANDPGSAPPSG